MAHERWLYAAQWCSRPAGIASVRARAEVVMVRRAGTASADSRADSSGYGDDAPAWPGTGRREPPAKAPWSGSGGGGTGWPLRVAFCAAIPLAPFPGVPAIAV